MKRFLLVALNALMFLFAAQAQDVTSSVSFTCGTSTVSDYDGNSYQTLQLGTQCWMKSNMKTTHYTDGTSIALGSSTSTTVAYRYYPNNSSANVSTYGYLYNWPAAMHGASSSSTNPSGVQGICPTGWHVPSDAEWTQLTTWVGSQSAYQCSGSSANIAKALASTWVGSQSAYQCSGSSANIAKALASTSGWNSSTNTCAVGNTQTSNNATGFGAVPAGNYTGVYYSFGNFANFWSATEYNSYYAFCRYLGYDNAYVSRSYHDQSYGFSVRCLRD